MADQHPIAPPQELIDQWLADAPNPLDSLGHVATQAARWGADQELEACCKWVDTPINYEDCRPGEESEQLRAARRPKPPSLKQQALADLDAIQTHDHAGYQIADLSNIRRALEQLND